nr:7961_t:CDS:2 [Entrophospora candida]
MKPVTKNAARSLESGTSPPAPSILSSLLSTSPNTKLHPKDLNHVRNGGHSRQSAPALSTTTTRNKNSMYNAMEVQLKKQYPDLEENDVVRQAVTPKPKKVLSPPRPKSPHSSKTQNFIEKNKKQIKKTVKKTKDDSPPISPTSTIKQQRSSSGTSGQSSFNITSRPHHQQQPSAGILKDTLKKKDSAATRRPPSPQNFNNSTSNHSKPTAHERSHVRATTPDSALREENKALKRLLEQYMDLLEAKENDLSELEEVADSLREYNSKLIAENESLRAYHKDHEANEFNNNSNDDNNGSNGSSPALLIMSSIKQNNKRMLGEVDNKVDDNKTLVTPLENIVPPSSSSKTITTAAKSPAASIIAAHTQPQPTLAKITVAKKSVANTTATVPAKSTTATTKNAIAPKTPVATSNMSRGTSLFNKLNNNIKPSASMATPLQSASSLKPEASHKTLIHDDSEDDDERPIEKFNKNNNEWGLNAASFKSDFVDEVTDSSNDEFEYEPPSSSQHYQNKSLNKNNLANSTTHFNKPSNSSTSSSVATTASVVSTSTKSNSLATSSNSSSDNKPKKRIVQSPISVSSSRVSTPSCESSYNRRNRYNNNNNSNSTASSVIPPPPPPPENKDTIATLQHFLRLISENSESNKDPKDFYDLKKVIDEGSSAQVFTAHALGTNEECAIKVVPLTYSLEFIFNEIFILKNLKHKNIVDFKESFVKWDGKTREVWLAMEKCARGDVTSRAGKVNQREVSRMARDVKALKHLHHNGIIHRDIKLSNILSCANNDVKLADFGISSLTPTSTTAMVGTIPYMAPDVVLVGPDRPYDTKVDVWSLGVCILELLTGKAAWGRIRDDEIMDKLRRGEMPYGFQRLRKKADIGWEVVDFLEKCFAKNPENRWDAERLLEHPFITNCY